MREGDSPPAPFDFAAERTIQVPRSANGALNEERLASMLRAQVLKLLGEAVELSVAVGSAAQRADGWVPTGGDDARPAARFVANSSTANIYAASRTHGHSDHGREIEAQEKA